MLVVSDFLLSDQHEDQMCVCFEQNVEKHLSYSILQPTGLLWCNFAKLLLHNDIHAIVFFLLSSVCTCRLPVTTLV